MNIPVAVIQKMDNGGRRSGIDLRQFSYAGHIPERRALKDRRCGLDRRSGLERRINEERRRPIDTREKQTSISELTEMRRQGNRRKEDRRLASM